MVFGAFILNETLFGTLRDARETLEE